MNKLFSTPLAVIATSLCLLAGAADNDKAATAPGLARTEVKDLKTQSEADYNARKKVAEANEVLNKADAKTVHGIEEKAIKDASK